MFGRFRRFGLVFAFACLSSGVVRAEPAAPADASPKDAAAATSTGSAAAVPGAAPSAADTARAQALFEEAVALTQQGKFPEACEKLEASYKLHAGAGTAFNLGRCWQKIGRTASAYWMFEDVVRKTSELGQTERAAAARAKMEALAPKLSRLRVDLSVRAARTEIRRSGAIVPESDWGKPVAVDPGKYEIKVTAEGKTPWSMKVDVSEPASTVAVVVPELSNAAPPAAKAVAAAPAKKPPPKQAESGSHWNRTIGIGAAVVGAAGVAFGIVKGAEYSRLNEDAQAVCPGSVNCTPDEIAQHEQLLADSRSARNWSYVSFGVGGVALLSAGYLIFLAPNGKESPKVGRLAASPILTADTWGASLEGRF